MIDKFLDAYKTWPPQTQLVYAVISTTCVFALLFLFGWWAVGLIRDGVYYFAVIYRGWPDDEEKAEVTKSGWVTPTKKVKELK